MIVTVSNEYGSGALEIAERVAGELGYEFVDRQLPVVVAKRLRVSPEAVEANEDAAPTLGERFLTGLERATPELAEATAEPFDAELLRAVQAAVRDYAARENVVILGRGASAILGARPDVLRVFIHAPRDWRIERVVAMTGVRQELVQAEVDRIDHARAAYVRNWYGLKFGDPRNYDLCIDTSRFDAAQSATLIVSAIRARENSLS
ncbi:MAG: cytidylate kinase-like family protein [Candidatus Eremiobacteraeota bacterium]|nr:cytidylate kinase-like family protein [Candidatus Eremiobacteraeota bacterium]